MLVAGGAFLPFVSSACPTSLVSFSANLLVLLCEDSSLITCVYLLQVPGGALITLSLWACSFSPG